MNATTPGKEFIAKFTTHLTRADEFKVDAQKSDSDMDDEVEEEEKGADCEDVYKPFIDKKEAAIT